MGRVIHFEICTDDLDPMADFYQTCFGWNITPKSDGYYLIHTGPQGDKGINGGMSEAKATKRGFIPTVSVTNLKESLATIEKMGGKIMQPLKPLPGTGYVAYCTDPKGNWFTLLEYNSDVK